MKRQSSRKCYPFRFSPLIYALFGVGLALCAVGFGLTLWQFLDFLQGDLTSVYGWITHLILFFASLFLAVIVIAMLIRSQYILTDTDLIMQFGIIRQKYAIKNIVSVHLFKGMNKLAVYFDDFRSNYIVIVVKDIWYDDFLRALLERKPEIGFSFSTPEEEEEFKNKK